MAILIILYILLFFLVILLLLIVLRRNVLLFTIGVLLSLPHLLVVKHLVLHELLKMLKDHLPCQETPHVRLHLDYRDQGRLIYLICVPLEVFIYIRLWLNFRISVYLILVMLRIFFNIIVVLILFI